MGRLGPFGSKALKLLNKRTENAAIFVVRIFQARSLNIRKLQLESENLRLIIFESVTFSSCMLPSQKVISLEFLAFATPSRWKILVLSPHGSVTRWSGTGHTGGQNSSNTYKQGFHLVSKKGFKR